MPRQYMQPQPGLFVGQSARQDMAQARARADQERIRQQRLQGFQYTGQARQAARTQREAQRAAQQQMAMASRERDADRQFQMQRDAFGARRDYAMQERRIQSAAEQAQFGRDFEREQQETRFGQQQDLARQEQDYRLQQLDIAAQDQFLSAEQQAEIQRERDMLVSDMQRDAAREGRFEQFGYGQMAADRAADRSSVAAREQAGISDWMDARHQGRAGDLARQQITQRHELGMEATEGELRIREDINRRAAGLDFERRKEILALTSAHNWRENRQQAWEQAERIIQTAHLENDAAEQKIKRDRDATINRGRDDERGRRLRSLRRSSNWNLLSPGEQREAINRVNDDVNAMDPSEFIAGLTNAERVENALVTKNGTTYNTDPTIRAEQKEPTWKTHDGRDVKTGEPYPGINGSKVYTDRNGDIKPVPDPRRDIGLQIAIASIRDMAKAKRKFVDPRTMEPAEEPVYTAEEINEQMNQILEQYFPSTPPQEQGGAADSRQRESAAPSAAPSADTGQPTGDTETTRWGWTQEEDKNIFLQTKRRLDSQDQTRAVEWAQNNKSRLLRRYKVGEANQVPFKDWSPEDRAIYDKSMRTLGTTGKEETPRTADPASKGGGMSGFAIGQ